ncbi:hypothetical protein AOLI_G00187230 [Acnodon oligacanthus]
MDFQGLLEHRIDKRTDGRCVSPCSRPHTPLNGHAHDSPGWSRPLRVRDGNQFYMLDQEEVHPLLMSDRRPVSHRTKLLRRTVSVPADTRPHPESVLWTVVVLTTAEITAEGDSTVSKPDD